MSEKPYTINIPKELKSDLLVCLKYNPPDFKFKYNVDYFLYIVSKITVLYSYNKFKNLQKVPISSEILRAELGKHYKRYLEYLLEFKFINTDNYYVVGDRDNEGKCKCYGLQGRYRNASIEKYEITKPCLLRKFLKWKEEKFGKITNDKLLGRLFTMMRNFTIDVDAAEKFLSEKLEAGEISERQKTLEMDKCHRINNKEDLHSLFLVKDSYGRVHTNFTNISRHIRENFLYLDGEKLVEIDIISSQPALLYTLVKKYLNDVTDEASKKHKSKYYMSPMEINYKGEDIRDKYVNRFNTYTGEHIYANIFSPRMNKFDFNEYIDMLEVGVEELNKYKSVLKNGIYEFFQERWCHYNKSLISRKKVKKEWIKYIFDRNNTKYNYNMEIIWKTEFPLINKILKHFKEGNHKTLAHQLQRKEADIIFNQLCPKIDDLNVDYFTVHDCIATKKSEAEKIRGIFEDVLNDNEILTGVAI